MDKELLQTMDEFTKYVYSFYGQKGIYPMRYNGQTSTTKKHTVSIIKKAIKIHIARLELAGNEFLADSMDREMVRDIMIDDFGLLFPDK